MLSLPFMKLPIVLPGDPDLGELEDQKGSPDKEVDAYIQVEQVETFYPGYYWGSIIVMKSGTQYMTRLKVEQLETAFAGYWQHCTKALAKSTEPAPIITLS